MTISIREAYTRIDDALDAGRQVILTDGTVTAAVTKVFGDADDVDAKWLTLALGDHYTTKSFEVNHRGELEGIGLRDTKDYLLIGPDWYIQDWPCDCTECVALFNRYCSVANCHGPVCKVSRTGISSKEDAARAYLLDLPK